MDQDPASLRQRGFPAYLVDRIVDQCAAIDRMIAQTHGISEQEAIALTTAETRIHLLVSHAGGIACIRLSGTGPVAIEPEFACVDGPGLCDYENQCPCLAIARRQVAERLPEFAGWGKYDGNL